MALLSFLDWSHIDRVLHPYVYPVQGKNGKDRLVKMNDTPVRRHVKIKADANPYLPEYGRYFWERRHNKEARLLRELSARQMRLAL